MILRSLVEFYQCVKFSIRHKPEGTEQVFHPKHDQVFIHPEYEFQNDFHKNDIALIKLERIPNQSETVSRVCWHPKDIKEHRNGQIHNSVSNKSDCLIRLI